MAQENASQDNLKLEYQAGEKVNLVEFYPNPVKDFIFIKVNDPGLGEVKTELRNIIGSELNINPERVEKDTYRISVEDFPTGFYLLVVEDKDSHFKRVHKFLKK